LSNSVLTTEHGPWRNRLGKQDSRYVAEEDDDALAIAEQVDV
jgi:hypothetical protein